MTQCYPRIIDRTTICPRDELTFSPTPPTCVRVVPVFGDFSIVLGQIPPAAHFFVTDRGDVYQLAPITSPPSTPPEYHALLDATGCVLIGVEMAQTPRRSLSNDQVEVLPGVIRHVLTTLNLTVAALTNALPPDRCNPRLWQQILDAVNVCLTAQPPAEPPVPQAFSCQAARDCFTAGPGVSITSGNPPYTISAGELRSNGNDSYTWFDTQGNAQFTFFAPGPIRQFIVPIGNPNNNGALVESPNLLFIPSGLVPTFGNLFILRDNFAFTLYAPFGISESQIFARASSINGLAANESSVFLDSTTIQRETLFEESSVHLNQFNAAHIVRVSQAALHATQTSLVRSGLFTSTGFASFTGLISSTLGYFISDIGLLSATTTTADALVSVASFLVARNFTTQSSVRAEKAFVSLDGRDERVASTNIDFQRGVFILDLNSEGVVASYNSTFSNSVVLSTFRGRMPAAMRNTILASRENTSQSGALPFVASNLIQLSISPIIGAGQNVDRRFTNGIWIGENVEVFGSVLAQRDVFVFVGNRVREDPYALLQIGRNASPTAPEIAAGGYVLSLYDNAPLFRVARHGGQVTTFFLAPSFSSYNDTNGQITLNDLGNDVNAAAQLGALTNNVRRAPGTLALVLVNGRIAIFAWNGTQWQRITV